MVTLDHNQFWKGATRFYHADTLPYWRKRKNLPHRLAAVDEASLREFAGLIRTYFHHTEGRGNNCVVDACDLHNLIDHATCPARGFV